MISTATETCRAFKKYFHLFVSLLARSCLLSVFRYQVLCSDLKTKMSKWSKTMSTCQKFIEVLLWTITHVSRSFKFMQEQNKYGLCPYRNSYLFLLNYLKIENTENHISHIPITPKDLTNDNISCICFKKYIKK